MNTTDNKSRSGNQLLMMMVLMFIMIFVLGNQDITNLIAVTLNTVFYPIIGFNGNYPVQTIILSGTMVVTLSSFFNNLFADWTKIGEMQEISKAFQKEVTSARKSGDTDRVNKLMKMQPEIMGKQMEAQSGMMKPMLFLFIFIIPIFTWLKFFLGGLSYYQITIPWGEGISLFYKPFLMQVWLWLYMIFSMVFGQVLRGVFKWISWSNCWRNIKKRWGILFHREKINTK